MCPAKVLGIQPSHPPTAILSFKMLLTFHIFSGNEASFFNPFILKVFTGKCCPDVIILFKEILKKRQ